MTRLAQMFWDLSEFARTVPWFISWPAALVATSVATAVLLTLMDWIAGGIHHVFPRLEMDALVLAVGIFPAHNLDTVRERATTWSVGVVLVSLLWALLDRTAAPLWQIPALAVVSFPMWFFLLAV